jgi:hypothetical protein
VCYGKTANSFLSVLTSGFLAYQSLPNPSTHPQVFSMPSAMRKVKGLEDFNGSITNYALGTINTADVQFLGYNVTDQAYRTSMMRYFREDN